MLPQGQQLLRGLYQAKQIIAEMERNNSMVETEYGRMIAKGKEQLEYINPGLRYVMVVGGIGCLVQDLVTCIYQLAAGGTGGIGQVAVMGAILVFLFLRAVKKKSNAAWGILYFISGVLMVICAKQTLALAGAGLAVMAVAIMFIVAGLAAGLLFTQAYNKHAAKKNLEVFNFMQAAERRVEQLQKRNNELAGYIIWFPRDYMTSQCADAFIRIVGNHRASTVAEMVNIFEQDSKLQQIMETQRRQDEEMERMRCAVGAALDESAQAKEEAAYARQEAASANTRADSAERDANNSRQILRRAGIR